MPVTPFHHFHLSPALVAASSWHTARGIMEDMNKFNLCRLPYPECVVSMRIANMLNDIGWFVQDAGDVADEVTMFVCLRDLVTWESDSITGLNTPGIGAYPILVMQHDNGMVVTVDLDNPDPSLDREFVDSARNACAQMGMLLISSLSAANVVQHTSVNNRVSRGIGNGKFRGALPDTIYISTTSLHPPSLSTGMGVSPRPHIRRGHIHTFLTGIGRSERVKKFVQPMFVNGVPPDRARNYEVR